MTPVWIVNHKKVQRLWRQEGLRVPERRRRKRRGGSTAPLEVVADAPDRVRAVDFQVDVTTDGRPVKIVSIIDEHTREGLVGMVDGSGEAYARQRRGRQHHCLALKVSRARLSVTRRCRRHSRWTTSVLEGSLLQHRECLFDAERAGRLAGWVLLERREERADDVDGGHHGP